MSFRQSSVTRSLVVVGGDGSDVVVGGVGGAVRGVAGK